MEDNANNPKPPDRDSALYCPSCARKVEDPLVCGDCSAVICRACGTPLESADELAMG
jgi:methionyl-tRNA synthetase